MAADTREPAPAGSSRPPSSSSLNANSNSAASDSPRIYETFSTPPPPPPPPPSSANALPGGTENTAGGRPAEVSVGRAVQSITLDDFRRVHRQPCVRDSLLLGIAGGFGVGGVSAVLGVNIPRASNWAVGTFVGLSFVMYEVCQLRRHREMDGMRQAIQIMDQKKSEREENVRLAREARRKAKEEEEQRESDKRNNSGWKFW